MYGMDGHEFDVDGLEGLCVKALPDIGPRFHVPVLADKPQNPIMDTMKLLEDRSNNQRTGSLPKELEILTASISNI